MRDKARRKAMDEVAGQLLDIMVILMCIKLDCFQDVLDVVEEDKSESGSSSEYEEYTDSEDETGPRLKPVFVPKTDRLSIKEKEALAKEEAALEQERKRQGELRKRESHRVSD